jgi:hypothetical protein
MNDSASSRPKIRMQSLPLDPPVSDTAPTEPILTAYDEQHLVTHLRLLDAEEEGADWQEVARIVLLQKNMPKGSPILIRIFKEESELEAPQLLSLATPCLLYSTTDCRLRQAPGMAPNRRRSIKKLRGAEQRGSTRYPPTTQYISGPAGFPEAFPRRRFPIGEPEMG